MTLSAARNRRRKGDRGAWENTTGAVAAQRKSVACAARYRRRRSGDDANELNFNYI